MEFALSEELLDTSSFQTVLAIFRNNEVPWIGYNEELWWSAKKMYNKNILEIDWVTGEFTFSWDPASQLRLWIREKLSIDKTLDKS